MWKVGKVAVGVCHVQKFTKIYILKLLNNYFRNEHTCIIDYTTTFSHFYAKIWDYFLNESNWSRGTLHLGHPVMEACPCVYTFFCEFLRNMTPRVRICMMPLHICWIYWIIWQLSWKCLNFCTKTDITFLGDNRLWNGVERKMLDQFISFFSLLMPLRDVQDNKKEIVQHMICDIELDVHSERYQTVLCIQFAVKVVCFHL